MPAKTTDDDASVELVRRIRSGERAAWNELYLRYHDSLLFAIRCRLGPRLRACVESEDILQSVFEDALPDLGRFEPRGRGSLASYLNVCVLNKIRGRAAHQGAAGRDRVEALSESSLRQLPQPRAAPDYFDGERYGELERALRRLDETSREVVILRAVEGLDNDAVAQRVGKTPAAASKLYNRALARLGTSGA